MTCHLSNFCFWVDLICWTLPKNARFRSIFLRLICTLYVVFVCNRFGRYDKETHIIIYLFNRFSRLPIFISSIITRIVHIRIVNSFVLVRIWTSRTQILLKCRLAGHYNFSVSLIQKRFTILKVISRQKLTQSLINYIDCVMRKVSSLSLFSMLNCSSLFCVHQQFLDRNVRSIFRLQIPLGLFYCVLLYDLVEMPW